MRTLSRGSSSLGVLRSTRTMIPTLTVAAILCICNSVIGQEFKNHRAVDKNGKYHVYWTVEGQNITVQVEVENKGWVGFGFNQKSIMAGADIVIGWVYPNGTAVFHDRNGQGFFEPLIDTEQNYALLYAHENETHTILRFTRLLNTCDKNDTVINDDTIRFLCTWHPDDPPQITGLPAHGPDRVATTQVYLLSPQPPLPTVTDDIIVWEVQMPNLTVPAQRTTYWCYFFKFPDYEDALEYIGYTVEVTPGNEHLVHHFQFLSCTENIPHYEEMIKTDGYQCINESTVVDPVECQPPVFVWAYGAKGQMLPDDVSIPIGGESEAGKYFAIEMHYNNEKETAGIKDNTKVKVFLTKKHRPIKAATLQIYPLADYTAVIPPKQTFKWTSYCPTECTQAFPKEGITIFSVGLHTHLTGRKIYLRHFRGKQELAPVSYDDNYDFDYQEMRNLVKPVVVLPGDVLMAECTYDTMDRNTTVMGGYGTLREMCFIYLTYYPSMPLKLCIGGPSVAGISDYFGVKIGPDTIHIESPPEHFNESMFDFEERYDWSQVSEAKIQEMYALQFSSTRNITCQYMPSTNISIYPIAYPADATFYVKPDVCTDPKVASENPTVLNSSPYQQPPTTPQSYEKTPKPQQSYEKKPPKPEKPYEETTPKPVHY